MTLFSLLLLSAAAQDAKSPDRAEVERIVREYILEHPEVLIESVEQHRARLREAASRQKEAAVAAHQDRLTQDRDTPSAGAASGAAIVLFFDYRCGYCRRAEEGIWNLVDSSRARVIFKELPILGADSMLAARAALAAHRQNAYARFHRGLMTLDEISNASIAQLAAELKLDTDQLQADMMSDAVTKALQRNRDLAEALEIQATPAFVIGKSVHTGALTERQLTGLLGHP
jgi:protein-disulfide isomerase